MNQFFIFPDEKLIKLTCVPCVNLFNFLFHFIRKNRSHIYVKSTSYVSPMIEITTFVFVIHGIIYVYKIYQIPCDTLDIQNKKNLLISSNSPFIYHGSNCNSNVFSI